MSHLFRILLTIFILILTAFVLMGIFAPKNFQVQCTKTIQASPSVVWAQMVNLKNWKNWSPWEELDTKMKTTYAGKDGDIGSKMMWEGNENVGTGELFIKSLSTNKELVYEMTFKEPMPMTTLGTILFQNITDSSIDITWKDYADLPFKFRPFMHFMNMDSMMGPQFERGLVKLDSVSREIYAKVKR